MRKEQTIRIRHGQCFGRLDRAEPITEVAPEITGELTNEELRDELTKSVEEIVERVNIKVDTVIKNLVRENGLSNYTEEVKTPVIESEVSVTATAALQKEVEKELAEENVPEQDEGKLEEVLAEQVETGKSKKAK